MNHRLIFSIVVLVVIVAVASGVLAAYVANRHPTAQGSSRRPIAVILDNISPDARPQSGLDRADMVIETLAEGGITRFMAIYQSQDASEIGPVRSTRLYFNHWAAGYGVIFGHDGGNVDAVKELPSLTTVFNEDADRVSGPFWRTTNRFAPHNEYTSTQRLRAYAQAHGGSVSGGGYNYPTKSNAPFGQRPAQSTLHVQFSYGDYNVDWSFDRASDTYLRSAGGAPFVEATTGKQIAASNVVVMYTDETPASDPFTPGAIHMRTEGTGRAVVYEDGKAIPGTWSKPDVNSPVRWLDQQGNEIALNRGPIWVEVIPKGNQVTTG